ncbi:MAG TPA: guanylate kinase [Gemmatimonadales bacterium]|nr:guanylate kinase [Gemmatimonadales bacterium]
MRPFLLVLSSPSGTGKTSIARRLLALRPDLAYSVSATTRPPRAGEEEGRDYHFLTRPEFEARLGRGEFLEHAEYGGNLYGTLRSEVERIFRSGRHAVLDIELVGARQLRKSFPEAVQVFVLPPSGAELLSRLGGRNTESGAVLRRRLAHALEELAAVGEYDYAVVNADLDAAVARIAAIVDAETARVARQDSLGDFVGDVRRELVAAAERFPVS